MQYNEELDYTKRFDLDIWKKLLLIAKPFKRQIIAILRKFHNHILLNLADHVLDQT